MERGNRMFGRKKKPKPVTYEEAFDAVMDTAEMRRLCLGLSIFVTIVALLTSDTLDIW